MTASSERLALDRSSVAYDLLANDDFKESDHPRAKNGEFGAGGSGGTEGKSAAGTSEKLTANEKSTISSYSGDDFLRINKALRDGDTSDPSVKRLDSAVSKGKLGGGTLYRGMTREAAKALFPGGSINAGDTISDKAFLSTSSDVGEASARSLGGVLLKIETTSGSTGLDLSSISRNESEKETLLPRNAKLKVLGVKAPKNPGDPVVVRVSYESNERANDCLAIDRMTVRRTDVDGRLHIEVSAISKANVCPYYGYEIPNAEALDLKSDQVYMLLRDPVELAKAAESFNNIQILRKHIAVSAVDPQKMEVVGATGSHATFTPPYLTNSLVIWDASAIAGIETDEQRELSSSYRYVADMTPGEYEGVPYDGRMTEIVGNHVALVETGRAGADVFVGDSLPLELTPMKLSQKAVAMRVALGAYLRPQLAQDGAIPAVRVLVKAGAKPERIAADAKTMFAKQFAVDEAALAKLLKLAADEADMDDEDETAMDEEEDDKDDKPKSKDKAKDKAKDEDKDEKDDKKGEDEEEDDKKKDDDKKASDAALVKLATENARAEFKAIRIAEEDVRPLVGAVAAMDSAEAVYRHALDSVGVDNKGVHASALATLVSLAKERKPQTGNRIANDAAGAESFASRFPTASKLRSA